MNDPFVFCTCGDHAYCMFEHRCDSFAGRSFDTGFVMDVDTSSADSQRDCEEFNEVMAHSDGESVYFGNYPIITSSTTTTTPYDIYPKSSQPTTLFLQRVSASGNTLDTHIQSSYDAQKEEQNFLQDEKLLQQSQQTSENISFFEPSSSDDDESTTMADDDDNNSSLSQSRSIQGNNYSSESSPRTTPTTILQSTINSHEESIIPAHASPCCSKRLSSNNNIFNQTMHYPFLTKAARNVARSLSSCTLRPNTPSRRGRQSVKERRTFKWSPSMIKSVKSAIAECSLLTGLPNYVDAHRIIVSTLPDRDEEFVPLKEVRNLFAELYKITAREFKISGRSYVNKASVYFDDYLDLCVDCDFDIGNVCEQQQNSLENDYLAEKVPTTLGYDQRIFSSLMEGIVTVPSPNNNNNNIDQEYAANDGVIADNNSAFVDWFTRTLDMVNRSQEEIVNALNARGV